MFLSNDFYKKLSGILLEADEDENVEGSGETIDTAPESKSTDGGTEDSNDNGEDGLSEEDLDDQTNDYTVDDNAFEDGEEEPSEEDDMESGEGSEEIGEELPETDEQNDNNNEISKKYMLASQFKELLIIINNLEKSMNNKREAETNPEKIHYIYIVLDKIDNLKSKINYYIINNFITKTYEDLLSSFLFLKRELELIISLIEKLTEGKEEE